MKCIYIFLVLMALGCLNSCLEDRTNLDYKTVIQPDSVFVTNLQTEERLKFVQDITNGIYRVKTGDRLQLDVEVFYQGDEELTYEWRLGMDVISTEKKLDYVCTETKTGMLLVYRKNAGNATCYKFDLIVQSPYASGFAILAKDKNVERLDFVEAYSEKLIVEIGGSPVTLWFYYHFVEHPDVYPLGNDGATLGVQEPVKLGSYAGFESTPLRGVQILDKNWSTSVTVSTETMGKMTEMGDEFIGAPVNLRPKEFATIGVMNLLLSESGDIYTRVNYDMGNPCTGRYSSDPLAFNDPYDVPDKGPVKIKAEHMYQLYASNTAFTLIYEKENKRFLASMAVDGFGLFANHDINYMTTIALPRIKDRENLPKGYTDLDAVDKELVTVIGPVANMNEMLFIFKDGANYYLQTNSFTLTNYHIPYQIEYAVKNCKIITSGEVSALLANAGSYFEFNKNLFFASGNALYSMSVTGENLKEEFRFPQTDKITLFRVMPLFWYNSGTSNSSIANRLYNGRVFCAAFENGDFKLVRVYDDPAIPGKPQYKFLVENHYDGGVTDILFY